LVAISLRITVFGYAFTFQSCRWSASGSPAVFIRKTYRYGVSGKRITVEAVGRITLRSMEEEKPGWANYDQLRGVEVGRHGRRLVS